MLLKNLYFNKHVILCTAKISINELKSLHVVQNDKKRFGKEC